jgi:hypothetical protein
MVRKLLLSLLVTLLLVVSLNQEHFQQIHALPLFLGSILSAKNKNKKSRV